MLQYMGLYGAFTALAAVFGSVTGVNADLNRIVEMQPKIQGNSQAALELIGSLNWLSLAFYLVVLLVIGIVLQASAIRKTIFSEEKGPFSLMLGPEERRLLLAQLTALGVFFIAYIGIVIGAAVIGALMSAVTGLLPTGVGGALMGVFAIILIVFAVCLLLTLSIRLSLFGVVTQVEKRISIKSWTNHTKGAFWELMGAFVLWGIVAIVISLVVDGLLQLFVGMFGASLTLQPTTFLAALNPITLLAAALKGTVSGFFTLGSICVGAFAWHQMQANATKSTAS